MFWKTVEQGRNSKTPVIRSAKIMENCRKNRSSLSFMGRQTGKKHASQREKQKHKAGIFFLSC